MRRRIIGWIYSVTAIKRLRDPSPRSTVSTAVWRVLATRGSAFRVVRVPAHGPDHPSSTAVRSYRSRIERSTSVDRHWEYEHHIRSLYRNSVFPETLICRGVVSGTMAASESWGDPYSCPSCGDRLPSPGAGFVDHLSESPDCESWFDAWRDRVSEDIGGGWMG